MRHLLDLDTYPLDRPESSKYASLVGRCKSLLEKEGMFELPGFMTDDAVQEAAKAAVGPMAKESHRHARLHNVYFRDMIDGVSADDPVLTKVESVNHTLCADQISGNPVVDLYEWAPFSNFLADVMGKSALYQMDDPLARVNIQASRDGEALNWHFDRSEFTTTILLQSPDEGGELEFRRDLRSADNPNYEGVSAVLRGEDPQVRKQKLTPGALNVFCGVNTMHRVTTVRGETDRMVAIFAYFEKPGVRMTEQEQRGFYGRSVLA